MGDSEKYKQFAHRKDLTFRQAERIDPLPNMLAFGELDEHLRIRIWDTFYKFFELSWEDYGGFNKTARNVAAHIGRKAFKMPIDEAIPFSGSKDRLFRRLKDTILTGHYGDCLEIVQVVLRSDAPDHLSRNLITALTEPSSPYAVVDFPH